MADTRFTTLLGTARPYSRALPTGSLRMAFERVVTTAAGDFTGPIGLSRIIMGKYVNIANTNDNEISVAVNATTSTEGTAPGSIFHGGAPVGTCAVCEFGY